MKRWLRVCVTSVVTAAAAAVPSLLAPHGDEHRRQRTQPLPLGLIEGRVHRLLHQRLHALAALTPGDTTPSPSTSGVQHVWPEP